MILFLDIETIPTDNQVVIDHIKSTIKHPGNISKPESIQKWYDENFDNAVKEALQKTALDALYGSILSIAWAINDNPVKCLIRDDSQSELSLLSDFFTDIANIKDGRGNMAGITKWVGHCISTFDIRFIWQRCVINQYNPPVSLPIKAKPWDDMFFDTRTEWTGGGSWYSGKSSLKDMSPVFGLNKSDTDGSMVYDMYLNGEFDRIKQYNMEDVEDVRTLYKRMNFIDI
jgi:predicted PolB exonuclease-like 3'-5' exonuclease